MDLAAPGGAAAFFGHTGVAIALGFASNYSLLLMYCDRSRCCLRHSKGRHRHFINGCPQARSHSEVNCAYCYGWYPRYLWSHHRSHPPPKKYAYHQYSQCAIVSEPSTYTMYQGYKHFASGICCGFSSLVRFINSEVCIGCWFGNWYRW